VVERHGARGQPMRRVLPQGDSCAGTTAPAAGGAAARAGGDRVCSDAHPDTTLADLRLSATRRLRRQRHVGRICRLGPRVVGELLDEIARYHGLRDEIDQRLARYAALDPVILAELAGDRFPALPIRLLGEDEAR
jgi:hypothetical protein